MTVGIFGRIQNRSVIGWAFDPEISEPLRIEVREGEALLAVGHADVLRPALREEAPHVDGHVGFRIELPKGRRNWRNVEIYAHGEKLKKTKQLRQKINQSTQTLKLDMGDPHFFIHIPKTAGTGFKRLLEGHFNPDRIFPSDEFVRGNGGLYPHFHEVIKLDPPEATPDLLIGHYPFATHHLINGESKKIVIFRDPVPRVVSNVFHMKNNDARFTDMDAEEIYGIAKWHFNNLQVRYMVDRRIHVSMRFLDRRPLRQGSVGPAIENMSSCDVVGIADSMERTVDMANQVFGWQLDAPARINTARSDTGVSDALLDRIAEDNALDIALYNEAVRKFEQLCSDHAV